ncbi:SIS domain-containing protein [Peribacillus sp. SCS-155]|uniref:SIS domain-containing protein n=1 Tax=Peribacillus sedimenti TaxID=3115297 RepID=UPI003905FB13
MMKSGDVLFLISNSGKAREALEIASCAKEQSVTAVAITTLQKSPLYKTADLKLCIPKVEEEHRIGTIASRMAQLNIIDALYLSLFIKWAKILLAPFNQIQGKRDCKKTLKFLVFMKFKFIF